MSLADTFGLRSPLGRRLIVWIVLFSSAVTLLLTGLQLYRDYRLDLDAIDNQFRQIERVHVPSLSGNLWATDFDAVQLHLDGIVGLRDLRYVEVKDDTGMRIYAGVPASKNTITREFPLLFRHRDRDQRIGTLTVAITLEGVYRRLIDTAVVVLLSNALKTFLVASFMLVLFQGLVGRYLSGIARRTETLTLHNLGGPIAIARAAGRPRTPDEIDALVTALEQMRRSLQESRDALASSERRYRGLFENTQDGMAIVDPSNGRFLDVNRSMTTLTGYTRAELLGMTVLDLGSPEEQTKVESALRQARALKDVRYEREFRRKDGHLVPVEVAGRAIDLDGHNVFVSVVRDVSDRRRVEAERARMARILDDSNDTIFVIDAETLRYRWVNQAAQRATGYSLPELCTMTPVDIVDGVTREDLLQAFAPLLEGKSKMITSERVIRRKDGGSYPTETRIFLTQHEGESRSIVVVGTDVSERKRAEAKLAESHQMLTAVIEGTTDAVFVKDLEGRYLMVNTAAARFAGKSAEEMLGHDDHSVFSPDTVQGIMERDREIMVSGDAQTYEEVGTAAGVTRHYLSTKAPYRDADGKVIGLVGVSRDVTEIKRAESEITRLGRAIDASGAELYFTDPNTKRIQYASPTARAHLGYSMEELRAMTPLDVVPGMTRTDLDDFFAPLFSGRSDMVARAAVHRRKDGSTYPIEARAQLLANEPTPMLLVIIFDITEQLRVTQALRERERAYTALLENLSGMAYRCGNDESWTMDLVSDGCYALTGYRAAELVENRVVAFGDLIHPDDQQPLFAKCQANIAAHQPCSNEYRIRAKDGTEKWVWDQAQGIYGDQGELLAIEGLVTDITARKQAEAETARLGRILDESSNEIYLFRTDDLRFVTVNLGALENLGYTLEEMRHMTPLELKPTFTPETFEKMIHPLRHGDVEQVTFTTVHRRKDGSRYPVEVRLHLSHREQPPVFVAVILDISERLRAEQEIDESRRRLESVVTSAPVVLWSIDRDGMFTLSEGKGLEQLGLIPGEVVGKSLFDVYRDYPQVMAQARRALAGESFSAEVNLAQFWFEVHYAPAHDARGRQIGALGVAVDITARRDAEQALRSERDFSSAVLETVASLVVVYDRQGRIVRFNRACERLTGYAFGEVEGRYIWDFLIPAEQVDAVKQVFANLTAGQASNRYENDWLTRAGAQRYIAWSNTILSDWGGAVQFVIAAGIDITDRRLAEAERERLLGELQTRNTEMENFVYTISHDLKNPLITIGGFAGMLGRDIGNGKMARAQDSIGEIHKAVELLKQHIEDVLELSRAGHAIATRRPVRLGDLVADVLAPMRERVASTAAEVVVAKDLPTVLVDHDGIQRVYTNLIDNAIKYRRADAPLRIDIGWQLERATLRLYVRDNGVGIDPKYQDRVFGLFQRLDTRTEGTGVGLAISRRVIEAHGGRMTVESEPGRGSTFWISLPDSVIVPVAVHPSGLDAATQEEG